MGERAICSRGIGLHQWAEGGGGRKMRGKRATRGCHYANCNSSCCARTTPWIVCCRGSSRVFLEECRKCCSQHLHACAAADAAAALAWPLTYLKPKTADATELGDTHTSHNRTDFSTDSIVTHPSDPHCPPNGSRAQPPHSLPPPK